MASDGCEEELKFSGFMLSLSLPTEAEARRAFAKVGVLMASGGRGGRLAALDLFRGLTVVGMIFVNNPGDWAHLYWPFDHAEWNGWTPTDLIFPWFLFIVGVAGVFSLEKRMEKGADRLDLARHAFRRGMTIVLVGWLMAFYPFVPFLERLGRLRVPGVLPRIGVVFVLGTWIVLVVWRRRVAGVAVALTAGIEGGAGDAVSGPTDESAAP